MRRGARLFCPSRLFGSFCTLRPKHVGPCSFHLHGELADAAIQHLRTQLADRDARIKALRGALEEEDTFDNWERWNRMTDLRVKDWKKKA